MNHYIALTRPGNAILTSIAVIAGAFIAKGPEDILNFQTEIAICCVSAMMLLVSRYWITFFLRIPSNILMI